MTIPSEPSTLSWSPEPPPPVRWRIWPLGERLSAGLLLTLGLAVLAIAIHMATGRIHLVVLALAAMGISLRRFFLPTTYELGGDGIHESRVGHRRRTPWTVIRRYEIGSAGVLLLPYDDRCPVDPLRGLYLPWGDHRDEVLAHLHYHLDRPVEL